MGRKLLVGAELPTVGNSGLGAMSAPFFHIVSATIVPLRESGDGAVLQTRRRSPPSAIRVSRFLGPPIRVRWSALDNIPLVLTDNPLAQPAPGDTTEKPHPRQSRQPRQRVSYLLDGEKRNPDALAAP